MYGLDPQTNLSPLVGCIVTVVAVGQYVVSVELTSDGPDSFVSIGADFSVRLGKEGPGATYGGDRLIEGAAVILRLLGRTVAEAQVVHPGTVRLVFDDGSTFEAHDSDSHYESYQLKVAGHEIVV